MTVRMMKMAMRGRTVARAMVQAWVQWPGVVSLLLSVEELGMVGRSRGERERVGILSIERGVQGGSQFQKSVFGCKGMREKEQEDQLRCLLCPFWLKKRGRKGKRKRNQIYESITSMMHTN